METAEKIIETLKQKSWKPSGQFPDTEHWSFLEARNKKFLYVVCLDKSGLASKDEVEKIKNYLLGFISYLSWFAPKWTFMQVAIIFPEISVFVDLSRSIPKLLGKVWVEKIIQFTPEGAYEESFYSTKQMDQYLGNFIEDIAGSRKIFKCRQKASEIYWALIAIIIGWAALILLIFELENLWLNRR